MAKVYADSSFELMLKYRMIGALSHTLIHLHAITYSIMYIFLETSFILFTTGI